MLTQRFGKLFHIKMSIYESACFGKVASSTFSIVPALKIMEVQEKEKP